MLAVYSKGCDQIVTAFVLLTLNVGDLNHKTSQHHEKPKPTTTKVLYLQFSTLIIYRQEIFRSTSLVYISYLCYYFIYKKLKLLSLKY